MTDTNRQLFRAYSDKKTKIFCIEAQQRHVEQCYAVVAIELDDNIIANLRCYALHVIESTIVECEEREGADIDFIFGPDARREVA